MNKMIKSKSLGWMILLVISITLFSSCKKNSDPDPVLPIASFQFEVSTTNTLEVAFTDFSQHATSYSWDFGDDEGTSTAASPTYTYKAGGTYTVKLTVTNADGTANHSKDVTVINPVAQNLILNGEFDDETIWAVMQHNPNNTGTLSIADGVAVFNKGLISEWGTEPHIGINQLVTAEAGTYQLDLNITTVGISDVWFEVWIGTEEPIADAEYNEDNGAVKVLSFNSWDCGDTNNTYSGPMAVVSCQDTDGTTTLDAGDYYLVIRTGGLNFAEDGITIDDVSMVKVD